MMCPIRVGSLNNDSHRRLWIDEPRHRQLATLLHALSRGGRGGGGSGGGDARRAGAALLVLNACRAHRDAPCDARDAVNHLMRPSSELLGRAGLLIEPLWDRDGGAEPSGGGADRGPWGGGGKRGGRRRGGGDAEGEGEEGEDTWDAEDGEDGYYDDDDDGDDGGGIGAAIEREMPRSCLHWKADGSVEVRKQRRPSCLSPLFIPLLSPVSFLRSKNSFHSSSLPSLFSSEQKAASDRSALIVIALKRLCSSSCFGRCARD